MDRPTLIVFARAPAIGVGKTRLARDIGRVEAWRVYRAMSEGLIRRLGRDPRWRLVVRVTPDRSRWPRNAPREPQGGGNLGRRLERAWAAHARAAVAFIGTDSPEVTPGRIARAFAAVRRSGAVFGPAEDGGFWLMALSPRRARALRLEGVRWSSEHALADAAEAAGAPLELLETLADVDDGQALRALRRREIQARVDRARARGDGVQRL
jgi:hypothetical protein